MRLFHYLHNLFLPNSTYRYQVCRIHRAPEKEILHVHLLRAVFAFSKLSLVLPAQQWQQTRNPSSSSKLHLQKYCAIRITLLSTKTESTSSITTAYLFARYIFVHAYEDDENENEDDENDENENNENENDENENDNDAFNADVFMTDTFFLELLRSLQTRTRRASKDENTLRNRQLIDKYITNFCALYRFQRITIPGIASNLEAYIARQMLTAYINNAEMRTGTRFRTCLNVFFDVRSLRSTLKRRTTTNTDKRLARAYLS